MLRLNPTDTKDCHDKIFMLIEGLLAIGGAKMQCGECNCLEVHSIGINDGDGLEIVYSEGHDIKKGAYKGCKGLKRVKRIARFALVKVDERVGDPPDRYDDSIIKKFVDANYGRKKKRP